MATVEREKLMEVAARIREMREIFGFSVEEMAVKTEVSPEEYLAYEAGKLDFPFTFIHKCSLAFGIGITDLLEGESAHLSSYTVTRKGQGQQTAREDGIEIRNLAPMFRRKIAEPYWVRYEYDAAQQDQPIHLTRHSGQEFDFIMKGRLKVQIGDNVEYLSEGDSIYYNSSTPHGMITVDGEDCSFVVVVLPGDDQKETVVRDTLLPGFGSGR
ncbi:MAG: cupin domain-containing protein, partial [Clostridia bacterium]|nr:cupin domain-containing protein [Clostridia bacterium]